MLRGAMRTRHRGRPAGALLFAFLGLGACEGSTALSPAAIWREVSGADEAARPPPPGLDRPFPSLASVPPRPERPSPEAREAITAALAADRRRSREPIALRAAPDGGSAPPAPGMAPGPPPRPALAAAPHVPWIEAAPPSPPVRGGSVPAAPPPARAPTARPAAPTPAAAAPAVPEVPDTAPAPPPPELLGAPPPPPDLSAPPPPPPTRR
jgi:hypothetical protein